MEGLFKMQLPGTQNQTMRMAPRSLHVKKPLIPTLADPQEH